MLISLVVIQFIRPDRNESELPLDTIFLEETNPSEDVKLILRSTCCDCHSNNTLYPWYYNVAPVSYWMASHIEQGKRYLNFSKWEKYTTEKKGRKLGEVIETVEIGFMPLNQYKWTHANARLSDEQRKAVIEWAEKSRLLYELGRQPQ